MDNRRFVGGGGSGRGGRSVSDPASKRQTVPSTPSPPSTGTGTATASGGGSSSRHHDVTAAHSASSPARESQNSRSQHPHPIVLGVRGAMARTLSHGTVASSSLNTSHHTLNSVATSGGYESGTSSVVMKGRATTRGKTTNAQGGSGRGGLRRGGGERYPAGTGGGGSGSGRGRLDAVTMRYYEHKLAAFNLLSVVTNPHQRTVLDQPIWETLWNSELLGGEGELEEYDPTYTTDMSSNPIWAELEKYLGGGGSGSGGSKATSASASAATSNGPIQGSVHSARSLDTVDSHGGMHVDLSEFERFLQLTGILANKFAARGEHLRKEEDAKKGMVDGKVQPVPLHDHDIQSGSDQDENDCGACSVSDDDPDIGGDDADELLARDDGDTTDSGEEEEGAQGQECDVSSRGDDTSAHDADVDVGDADDMAATDDTGSAAAAAARPSPNGVPTQSLPTTARRRRRRRKHASSSSKHRQRTNRAKAKGSQRKQSWQPAVPVLQPRRYLALEQCDAQVPPLFFSPYFDIEDARTFENALNVVDEGVAAVAAEWGFQEILDLPSSQPNSNPEEAHTSAVNGTKPGHGKEQDKSTIVRTEVTTAEGKEDEEGDDGRKKADTTTSDEDAGSSPRPEVKIIDYEEMFVRKQRLHQTQLSLLTRHLDAVEVALLEQVRSKSQMYFTETNRFAELKLLVHDSIDEVNDLRERLVRVKKHAVQEVEGIPQAADTRKYLEQLRNVLDLAGDVVTAKTSIGGLVAAGDFRGAIEAMQCARTLLVGSGLGGGVGQDVNGERHEGDTLEAGAEEETTPFYRLEKLRCLHNVPAQLLEYERLIVDNLSSTLVDLFLSWEYSTENHRASFASASFASSRSLANPLLSAQSRVRELVGNLALLRKLSEANDLYTSRLCDMVKVTVRTTVSECAADNEMMISMAAGGSGGTTAISKRGTTATTTGGALTSTGMATGVGGMSFEQFISCLDMLFEQLLNLLRSAVGVSKFLREEGIILRDEDVPRHGDGKKGTAPGTGERSGSVPSSRVVASGSPTTALSSASDLSQKSISELLRMRKDAHSLVSFDEMKRLWDTCLAFTLQLEKFSGSKAYGLRSTLLSQAKGFVERKHESHMGALVAALDSEKWQQCDVSAERQAALTRLCSGRAVLSTKAFSRSLASGDHAIEGEGEDSPTRHSQPSHTRRELAEAEIEGSKYKVVWSCLLLVEMVMADVSCAAHFQTLATNMVGKICEVLRLFNTRTTQLVLGAGAIHSAARLKSINAKHLALVTQCLGLVIAILPHVRAALMAQLPSKQHLLLVDLDRIKKDYAEHTEKVLNKFVSIIGGIVEHGLAPRIPRIDFDQRAAKLPKAASDGSIACCPFLEGITTNTKKMHQVLSTLLPPEHLRDVFSRIFVFIDQKVPSLFITAASASAASGDRPPGQQSGFSMPTTEAGKERMILECKAMAENLNALPGLNAWDFTTPSVLERELGIGEKIEKEEVTDDSEPKTNEPDTGVSEMPENGEGEDKKLDLEGDTPLEEQSSVASEGPTDGSSDVKKEPPEIVSPSQSMPCAGGDKVSEQNGEGLSALPPPAPAV